MNILLCHNFYQQRGGEYQVFQDEAELLERHGHRVIRYTRHNDEINRMSRGQLVGSTVWNHQTTRELRELIRRERPEVMHCTNTFPLISPTAYHAAKAAGVAVVQSLHNYRILCPQAQFLRNGSVCEACQGKTVALPAIRYACYRDDRAATAVVATMNAYHWLRGTWTRSVDAYVALTNFGRNKFIEGGLPANRIFVKPNFVSGDVAPGAGTGSHAVFVGRLSEEKGVRTLLRAWQLLQSDVPLLIIGTGPLEDMVREAAATDHRIQPLGYKPFAETLDLIGNARFLVMPSIWYETFGRTLIEAFAKGTPVVASRLGAMAEIVDDRATGRLFAPGDSQDLKNTVEWMMQSPEAVAAMRREARRVFEERYTPEINYTRLRHIYDVAASRSTPLPHDAKTHHTADLAHEM